MIKFFFLIIIAFGCNNRKEVKETSRTSTLLENSDTSTVSSDNESIKIIKGKKVDSSKDDSGNLTLANPIILQKELDGIFIGYVGDESIFKDYSNHNILYKIDESDFTFKKFKEFKKNFQSFYVNDLGVLGLSDNSIELHFFDGKVEVLNISFEINNLYSNKDFSQITFNKTDTDELYLFNKERELIELDVKGYNFRELEDVKYYTKQPKDVYNTNLNLFKGGNLKAMKELVSGFFQDGWCFSPTGKYFLHSKDVKGSYNTKIIDLNTNKTLFELGDKSEYFSYYSKVKRTFIIHK